MLNLIRIALDIERRHTTLNEDNKRESIKQEIERTQEVLRATTLLFDNGFVNDAVSKLYYFLLYNIRTLLFTKGFEPKTHEV